MSQVSYAAGTRFLSLIGGTILSLYDWYADLPPASPQVFGDQTDVPESADWWNASYLIIWGTNLSITRTPDAHFMAEARYRGQKVVVVSPDYSDHTKFARFLGWLRVTSPIDVARSYVEAFDLNRRGGLYLTYYRYGDTRQRGMSLLAFKTAYRAAGLIPTDHELPDYLPITCRWFSTSPRSARGESRYCATTAPIWNSYADLCRQRNPPMPRSWTPSALTCRDWTAGTCPSSGGSRSRGRRRRTWGSTPSPRPTTSRAPGHPDEQDASMSRTPR
jgi:nitrate reductase molybdenum cofactor assembly chaperone